MAVQQRQARGQALCSISIRLPKEQHDALEDFAWNHRLSMASAVHYLLEKAMATEDRGTPPQTPRE